jgi:hypothetical protein
MEKLIGICTAFDTNIFKLQMLVTQAGGQKMPADFPLSLFLNGLGQQMD